MSSVRFSDDDETLAEHTNRCDRADHFEYVFGVYDTYGQRVNAYRSIACGTGPCPDPAACATVQAPLWPGFSIAVWADPSIAPPAKLASGPAPDATAG